MSVDMNQCKPGDQLILRNKERAKYLEFRSDLEAYNHFIQIDDTPAFSVTHSGFEWAKRESKRDVIAILPQSERNWGYPGCVWIAFGWFRKTIHVTLYTRPCKHCLGRNLKE